MRIFIVKTLLIHWQKSQPYKAFVPFFLCAIFTGALHGQIKLPEVPRPANIAPIMVGKTVVPNPTTSQLNSFNTNRYKSQMAMHESDVRRVEEHNQQMNRLRDELLKSDNTSPGSGYALPSLSGKYGTKYYREAFSDLLKMASEGLDIKKSVFIVENAFYGDKKDYSEFDKVVKKTGDFLREKIKELGYDENSNLAKNFLLFQFFADTLEIKAKNLKHLPLTYDFDDYMGNDDWSKMFVHKLLETGKGQCNSLPRLYLVLAEEIGAKAHLAYSPNHSYIKFQDDLNKRKWYNVELTNGMLTTNAFILQSGYIKAEALQNKIYMQPIDENGFLAGQFSELALGYIHKFGYDEFIGQVVNKALEISPESITAHLIKSNFLTVKLQTLLAQLGITKDNFGEIRRYPNAVQLYRETIAQYEKVDTLGYSEMPPEIYQKWLGSLKEAKQLEDNKSIRLNMGNTIKH